jgi:uncharacterized protein (DUF1499 family)
MEGAAGRQHTAQEENRTMERSRGNPGRRKGAARTITALALALAVVGLLVLASASVGYQLGWWGLGRAFAILRFSLYAAIAVAVLAVIAVVVSVASRHWTAVAGAALAILLAAGTAAVPLAMQRTAQSVPRIHDIATDSERPPEFVALRAERERSPNGAAYGGPEVAAEQRRGYPDIAPLLLRMPPDRAFGAVEATVRDLGWEIVAAVPAEGRLEATDTTKWFRFKDDVVVRVAPAPDGSRVDIRSVSRVGRSDLGANAQRIRAFLLALSARTRA